LLRAHLLERAPEYVPIAGPLVVQAEDRLLDLAPFAPSVAVPALQLRDHPALADCEQLIDRLLETNQKLEQEAVEATLLLPSFADVSIP
jgi:hypothetical protein